MALLRSGQNHPDKLPVQIIHLFAQFGQRFCGLVAARIENRPVNLLLLYRSIHTTPPDFYLTIYSLPDGLADS